MPRHTNAGSRRGQRRRIMRALKINEISGVDVPAQEGATAVIMKRKVAPGRTAVTEGAQERGRREHQTTDVAEKNGGDLVDLLSAEENGHQHGIRLFSGDDGSVGLTVSFARGPEDAVPHDHPVVQDMNGDYSMGKVDGHTHELDQNEMRRVVFAFITKAKDAKDASVNTTVGTEEDDTMTEKTGKATDNQPTVEGLQAQLQQANAIAALNDAEKAHMGTLDTAAKAAFLAKSAEDRKAEVSKVAKRAADADPVEYETLDGVQLRKSAGAAFIAMAKSNDVLRKRLDESEEKRTQDALEKRADAELEHLPGTVAERASLLQAVEGIEDEGQRKAALNALKAQNMAMSKAFETLGHGGTPVPGSPDDQLESLAKEHNKANPGLTHEQAYDAVLKTVEGRELYNKSVN